MAELTHRLRAFPVKQNLSVKKSCHTAMGLYLNLFSRAVLMVTVAGCASSEDAKNCSELDGTWTIIKMEAGGNDLLRTVKGAKLIVKDGNATFVADELQKHFVALSKYLDPSKTPSHITCPLEGSVCFYGIYEVDAVGLRVCGEAVDTAVEKDPEYQQPQSFDSQGGLLMVFERGQ